MSFICTLYNSSIFLSGIYLWNTWRSYECIVWLDSNELRTCVCSCCGSLVEQLAAAAGRLLPNVGSDQVAGAAIDHTPCVHSFHLLTPLFPRSRNSRSTGLPRVLLGFASGIYSSGSLLDEQCTTYLVNSVGDAGCRNNQVINPDLASSLGKLVIILYIRLSGHFRGNHANLQNVPLENKTSPACEWSYEQCYEALV